MENNANINVFVYDIENEGVGLTWLTENKGVSILKVRPGLSLYLQSEKITRDFVEKLVTDFNKMVRLQVDKGEE